jgi:hypothetical protein
MNTWPNKPLILITKGAADGCELKNVAAIKGNAVNAYRGYGLHLVEGRDGDEINEWEEATAVPTTALKRLRDVFLGVELPFAQFAAIQQVTSRLPAGKPTPLDQAVVMVEDMAEDMGGPMVMAETLPADSLSLLLDALAGVQGATRKAAPLALFARICVDWANVDGKRSDSLEAAQRQADALSVSHDFIALSALVADVITAMDENFSPHRDLIDATAYAIAWAARIIEEEE